MTVPEQPTAPPDAPASAPAVVSVDDIIAGRLSDVRSGKPPRRQNDAIRILLAILIPLAVIVLLVVAAELWLRYSVSASVREAAAAALHVDASDVQVDLGEDLAVVQYVNGEFAKITATAHGVDLGPFVGDATVTVRQMPVDRSLAVGSLSIEYTVPQSAFAGLVAASTGLTADSASIEADRLSIQTKLDLGIVGSYDATVRLRPGDGPGSVTLDPEELIISGQTIKVENVRELPVIGAFIAPLLAAKEVCIADHVPQGLAIAGFAVDGDALRIDATAQGVPFDETLAADGLCTSP